MELSCVNSVSFSPSFSLGPGWFRCLVNRFNGLPVCAELVKCVAIETVKTVPGIQ